MDRFTQKLCYMTEKRHHNVKANKYMAITDNFLVFFLPLIENLPVGDLSQQGFYLPVSPNVQLMHHIHFYHRMQPRRAAHNASCRAMSLPLDLQSTSNMKPDSLSPLLSKIVSLD